VSTYDLIVRGGTIVGPSGPVEADLAVEDGRIAEIAPNREGTAQEEIDARGLHILPGAIDAHAHFNEPGRTHWEGFVTGSQSLAAGGITAYIEMPLNAYPPTCDAESFDLKLKAAKECSLVDFAFYGGIVPGNVDRLEELADRGVAGLKAFMATSGTLDFQPADDLTLYEGMAKAAELGLPVLVHAENKAITDALAERAVRTLRTTMRDYLDSRPGVAELEAINRAILFAEETSCSLHVALVAAARERGVDVTCETCAHYLVLTDEDAETLGAVAKCAPPLRPQKDLEELWEQLREGNVKFVTSDHSPCPPEMKTGDDYFRAWGGIAGCQSLLNVMLDEGYHGRGLPLEEVAMLLSGKVANRFGLSGKGRLEVGADADLALIDLNAISNLQRDDLLYRHKISPYVGCAFHGKVVRTIVRGTTVFRDGKIISEPIGKFIKPGRQPARVPAGNPEKTLQKGT
jgi:allantoinase